MGKTHTTLSRHAEYSRKGRVSSSHIAPILGLHPWKGEHGAWREIMGNDIERETSEPAVIGTALEDPILKILYPYKTGRHCEKAPPKTIPGEDWSSDNADGLDYEHTEGRPVLVEAKTHGMSQIDQYGPEGSSEVPIWEYVQCLWHLRHWRDHDPVGVQLIALLGQQSLTLCTYWIEPNHKLEDRVYERARRWYGRHIVEGIEPDADHHKDTRDWLAETFPGRAPTEYVDAPEDVDETVREYLSTADYLKDLTQQNDARWNRLVQRMKTDEVRAYRRDDWRASFKKDKNGNARRYCRWVKSKKG